MRIKQQCFHIFYREFLAYLQRCWRGLSRLALLLTLLLAQITHAESFHIDFSSAKAYVDSLNSIRNRIGSPLPHLRMHDTTVYVLTPTSPNMYLIDLDGIDIDQRSRADIQLVLHPENLYLVGFINRRTNTFYRFSDFANVSLTNAPNITQVITLNADSSYTTLQRIGNTSRLGMSINRYSLASSYMDLRNFSGSALTQSAARALLRLITVSAEALRFRQIQRNFRQYLDHFVGNEGYIMSEEDVDLTLNWARISNTLPDYRGNESMQVGRVRLEDVRSVLLTVAVILNCRYSYTVHKVQKRDTDSIKYSANSKTCPKFHPSNKATVLIKNRLWDSDTLNGALNVLY